MKNRLFFSIDAVDLLRMAYKSEKEKSVDMLIRKDTSLKTLVIERVLEELREVEVSHGSCKLGNERYRLPCGI